MMHDADGDSGKDRKEVKRLARQVEAKLEQSGAAFIDLFDAEAVFHYYLEEGELQRAERLLVATRSMYPRSGVLSQWHAMLALENGHPEDALVHAEEAVQAAPEDIRTHLLHSEVLTRNGRYDDAREILNELMGTADHPEQILLQFGDIAQIEGNLESSERYYREALTMNPDFVAPVYELAALLEVQSRADESIALLTAFLNRSPYLAAGWYELGSLQARMDMYVEALDSYEYALAIDEDMAEAWYRKGLCLMALNRFQEALPVLLEVLNKKHGEPHVHHHTALCYEQLEMYADAGRHFHLAASSDKFHTDAWRGLGRCFAYREQYLEAIRAYQKAIDLEDDQAETYLDIAICEYKLGNNHAAGTHMQSAIRTDSSNPDIWLNWAHLHAQHIAALRQRRYIEL
jgi:tetratricopeptide (TPR) repeat protein